MTSLETFVNLHAIEPTRSLERHRVGGKWMAWKLHAIEQMQSWEQRRVDGVI